MEEADRGWEREEEAGAREGQRGGGRGRRRMRGMGGGRWSRREEIKKRKREG
jgi:hypothetical protein